VYKLLIIKTSPGNSRMQIMRFKINEFILWFVTVVIIIILAGSGLIETEGTTESNLTDKQNGIFAAIGARAPNRKKVRVDQNGNVRPVWK
jgi:hypothetical protein